MNQQSNDSRKSQSVNIRYGSILKTPVVLLLLITLIVILFWGNSNLKAGTSAGDIQYSISHNIDVEFDNVNINLVNTNSFLELINIDYPVRSSCSNYITESTYRIIPGITSDLELNHSALEAVKSLFYDAKEEGFSDFYISSAYRTFEKQKQLYDNAPDKAYVQQPNYSEHQTGLAVDIVCNGVSEAKMAKSKENKWLEQNAWEYGLIVRYPEGKSEITKIAYEPWHYRFIGFPHSFYCYVNNLCLEEYIQFLKENGNYGIEVEGIKYYIFYETPENGMIKVPRHLNYETSRDNTGGYIITARKK